jgi:hypothetical protein
MAIWYEKAIKEELPNAGNFLTSAPWRGVLHTTEGSKYAGALVAYKANNSAPHFTISYESNQFQVWQHIPINKAARALKNKPGGVETNRLRCIQIEIVWKANEAHLIPVPFLDGLKSLMRWIEANTTIRSVKPVKPFATQYGQTDRRMTGAEWTAFNGWCGHCHVPENDHWDPGSINIDYLLKSAVQNLIIGTPVEVDVQLTPVQLNIPLDSSGKGWIRVPYQIDTIVGLKAHSGTRPGVDGHYDGTPDEVALTPDDDATGVGSVVVVQGGVPGATAPVWFHVIS